MRGCVRTHQVRSNALWQDLHFKSTFLPFAHHVCCNDLHNTKYQKLYKMLVINAAKSLTNISKGGSNKQYLTPINGVLHDLSLEDPKMEHFAPDRDDLVMQTVMLMTI
jgi:hypothetical protein